MTRRDLASSLRPVHGQKDPRFPSHGAIAPQGELGHMKVSVFLLFFFSPSSFILQFQRPTKSANHWPRLRGSNFHRGDITLPQRPTTASHISTKLYGDFFSVSSSVVAAVFESKTKTDVCTK